MDQIVLFWQSMDETTRTLLISGTVFFGNAFLWFIKRSNAPAEVSEIVQKLLVALDNTDLWRCGFNYIEDSNLGVTIFSDGSVAHENHFFEISSYEKKLLKKKARLVRATRINQIKEEQKNNCKDAILRLYDKSKEQA